MLTELAKRFPAIQGLLDFAFPPLCAGCGEFSEDPSGLCTACMMRIDWYEDPFCLTCGDFIPAGESCERCGERSLLLFPAGNYVDPLKKAVINYKFHGATTLASSIAERVVHRFRDRIGHRKPALLVPIPLHPSREHVRGYNQAELFSRALSDLLDLPVETECLFREKKRRPQARLRKSDRAANVEGVFAVDHEVAAELQDSRVILVDDVVTSGSTVLEAARVLESGGVQVVGVISMAHGL
jgi:ComF family protein